MPSYKLFPIKKNPTDVKTASTTGAFSYPQPKAKPEEEPAPPQGSSPMPALERGSLGLKWQPYAMPQSHDKPVSGDMIQNTARRMKPR